MSIHDHDHDHDDGDAFVATLSRRTALGVLAAFGFGVLAACGSDADSAGSPTSTGAATPTTSGATGAVSATSTAASATTDAGAEFLDFPEETNGPFPADGSNDDGNGNLANVLSDARVIRSDITANLDGTDVQPGIPMALTMVIGSGGAALAGAAVYVWHCSRDGHYSVYNSGMNGGDFSGSTWFRGVQVADATGAVTFDTIFPGRYQGRATHIHFEVYEDDSFSNLLLTSQIGFDDADADAVYATDADYAASLSNPTYNAGDNVFADGDGSQITDLGDPSASTIGSGLVATVAIGV
jgi:protocatechuate 3,4-dioxygenase beta subunit